MNGKAARRIHRAAYQVLLAGTGTAPSKGNTHKEIVKTLKREYRQCPYHKRDLKHLGIRSLSHREQEKRWNRCNDQRLERLQELLNKRPYGPDNPHPDWSGYEDGEPDDHSPFRSAWEKSRGH